MESDPTKSPLSYSWVTYVWIITLSAWGGVVNFFQALKDPTAKPHSVVEFIGEIATSAFVGVLTFWMCEARGFSHLMTAVLVGISGHMGTRSLYQLEAMVLRWIQAKKEK